MRDHLFHGGTEHGGGGVTLLESAYLCASIVFSTIAGLGIGVLLSTAWDARDRRVTRALPAAAPGIAQR